jgi:N-acetylglucosamine-6-sulfatase
MKDIVSYLVWHCITCVQYYQESYMQSKECTRREWLAGMAAAPALKTRPARRNVIFFLTDDHRYNFIGALGHPMLGGHTPNLDNLVRRGIRFRNAFVTTSLCSPSRATILTGQYMHSHGVTDNFYPLDPKHVTFPQILQEAGYRTGFIGKWHMGGSTDEPQPGFSHWLSFRGQGEYENPHINRNGVRERARGNMTDVLTGEAARFIRENASRPFCLYLSHKAVHAFFEPPKRYAGIFANSPVPKPPTFSPTEEQYAQWPEWVRRRAPTRHGVDGMLGTDAAQFDMYYRKYCECLAGVDESLGQVWSVLDSAGLLEDTLFLYMGDNGYMWGEHRLIDKRAMYESSILVPMLAHCPALFGSSGRTIDEMALNLDIAPTILEAAACKAPPQMQGRSLLPLTSANKPGDWRREFVYEYAWEQDYPYTPSIVGLRTETHSLMHYPGVWDIPELYDLRKDPNQITNLLADTRLGGRMRGRYFHHVKNPETRALVASMQEGMAKILGSTGGDPRLAGQVSEGDTFAF